MLFHRVLVPVDLGDLNRPAVELACNLTCLHDDGHLILLHVIERIEDEPDEEASDFYATLEEKARRNMEALVDGLDKKPTTIERKVTYGRRLAEILAAVAECRADLVVLRSHRVDPAREGGRLGTLSHEVALLAEIPVLLVK